MSVSLYILPVDDKIIDSVVADPWQLYDLRDSSEDEVWCLGNTYHGITYLLSTYYSNQAPEFMFLEDGGPADQSGTIGKYDADTGECEIDMGYGPAWYCRSHFVRQLADRIHRVGTETFRAAYDSKKMTDDYIVPMNWDEEGEQDYLFQYFDIYLKCLDEARMNKSSFIAWYA